MKETVRRLPHEFGESAGLALLRCTTAQETLEWRLFRDPVDTFTVASLADVMPAVEAVAGHVASGLFAAGFIGYEASPAFDPALHTQEPHGGSLLWFGIYDHYDVLPDACISAESPPELNWISDTSLAQYEAAFAAIRRRIAKGDTYQANFTYRMQAEFRGSAWRLFCALVSAQHDARYSAFLNTGTRILCSTSPELFFRRTGRLIECRPMKGTAARGRYAEEDERRAQSLRRSPKERAENVMIVDMIRNDLGKIARTGSVRVPELFRLERFQTVWQMISRVTAESDASFPELLRALFPCASVTGAPKASTMRIIADLETSPRGAYTGMIGCLDPSGDAQFNVAIRTIEIDPRSATAHYGTGSGIVWDSRAAREFAECQCKAAVLFHRPPAFDLLETMLWRQSGGFFLLERHLARLADSARYFGFPFDAEAVRTALSPCEASLQAAEKTDAVVRLLLSKNGTARTETVDAPPRRRRWRVAVADKPVARDDVFLFHKTTHRETYDRFRARQAGHDDVILWNPRREITESTCANVVVRSGRHFLTPPISCGLLAGTFRAELLHRGKIQERVIRPGDLCRADAVYLINSVRGWIKAELDADTPP